MSVDVPQTSEQQLLERDDCGSPLEPPRFTLRGLLMAMTALCCLFALLSAVGTMWSMVVLLFASLVLAHVLGNSLGTRLRDRASRRVECEQIANPKVDAAPIKLDVFSPQRLTERARLHRITLVITLGGAIVGSFLGGTTSVAVYPDAGPAAISLGAISAAVLGAFAGFAVSSFASVAHQALREALGDPTVHRRVQHGRH